MLPILLPALLRHHECQVQISPQGSTECVMTISRYKSRNFLVASGRAKAFKFVEGFLFMFNFISIKGGILLYCTITGYLNTIVSREWMSKC
jgi:hypothetical protein